MAKRNPLENVKPVSGFSPNLEQLKRQLGILDDAEPAPVTTPAPAADPAPEPEPTPAPAEAPAPIKASEPEPADKSEEPARRSVQGRRKSARKVRKKTRAATRTDDEAYSKDQGEPPDAEPVLYSIGEVASQTDLESHVLRYWESQFEQLQPVKSSSGKRMYREEDVKMVHYIKYLLKEAKYTIDGARQVLERSPDPGEKITVDRKVWVDLRSFLVELKNRLPSG